MTSKRMGMKLVVAVAALAFTACNVDEAGKIKCADDASCPSDYPVCSSGVCIAGSPTTQNSVAVVGVPGKQAADPVRGTVTVQVAARASSGVSSVTLSSGAQSFSGSASGSPGIFNVPVDTTKFADGSVTLTATVTAGNGTTLTANGSLVVDNTAPSLTSIAFGSGSALNGALVQADVTSNEKLASFTATISPSASSFGPGTELSPATGAGTGEVRHLSFTINDTVAPGTYTITITGKDAAGNVSTAATKDFTVDAASGALGGAAIITKGDSTTLSASFGMPPGGTAKLTNNKNSSVVILSGSPATITVSPDRTTTYTLTVSGVSGVFSPTDVTVTVVDATDISAFTPSAVNVSDGDNVTLTATVANATAAGVTGSTTASLFANATCSGAPLTTALVSGGTVSFTPTAPTGSVTGATQSYCVSIPNAAGTATKATAAVSVFTAAAGTLAFKTVSSGTAGGSVTLTVSGVPVSTGATIAPGYLASVNGVSITQNGDITFNNVVVNTTFSLTVTDPAGGIHATGTTPATYTATPAIQSFTAVINPGTPATNATSATVGTTPTVTFNLTYLPGGNGTATGTITATRSGDGSAANVFTGGVNTITLVPSGTAQSRTVNLPSTTTLGNVVFTPSVGAANGTPVTVTLVGAVTGATLTGATSVTIGSSATLTVGYGTNGQNATVRITTPTDATKLVLASPSTSAVVQPNTIGTYTYVADVTNSLGGGLQTTAGVSVNVVDRANIVAVPSSTNVTDGDTFTITATVPNAGAAGLTTGANCGTTPTGTCVRIFQNASGDCASGELTGGGVSPQALTVTSGVGAVTFSPPAVTGGGNGTDFKYCLQLSNAAATASTGTTKVTAFGPPTITSFVSNNAFVAKGGSTTFSQTYDAKTGGTARIFDDTAVDTSLTVPASPSTTSALTLNRTTRYTLVVTNPAGRTVSRSVIVEVFNTITQTLNNMSARFDATATLLTNGKVLIAGGAVTEAGTALATAILYDPSSNTFVPTGGLVTARRHHTAHALSNGRALIIGGWDSASTPAPLASIEVFDSAANSGAGAFSTFNITNTTGGMTKARAMHASTVTATGAILVTGGCGNSACDGGTGDARNTAEVITITGATTGTTAATTNMQGQHVQHTATAFGGGILVAGGSTSVGGAGTILGEFYDGTKFVCPGNVATGAACTPNQPMTTARAQHAAVLLPNGQVALFGGQINTTTMTGTIETFDPTFDNGAGNAKGKFTLNGASFTPARRALTATPIGNPMRVLVVGGFSDAASTATNASQLFDVSLTTFTNVTPIDALTNPRGAHTATAIGSATVLIAGGVLSAQPGETFFTQ